MRVRVCVVQPRRIDQDLLSHPSATRSFILLLHPPRPPPPPPHPHSSAWYLLLEKGWIIIIILLLRPPLTPLPHPSPAGQTFFLLPSRLQTAVCECPVSRRCPKQTAGTLGRRIDAASAFNAVFIRPSPILLAPPRRPI